MTWFLHSNFHHPIFQSKDISWDVLSFFGTAFALYPNRIAEKLRWIHQYPGGAKNMKIQKKTHKLTNRKMKLSLICILISLEFIGLLSVAHISLATEGIWKGKPDMPTAKGEEL